MAFNFRFVPNRYVKLIFNALFLILFGIALVGLGATLINTTPITFTLLALLGLLLVGLSVIGLMTAIYVSIVVVSTTLVHENNCLYVKNGSKILVEFDLSRAKTACYDYERFSYGKTGFKLDPTGANGIRLLTKFETIFVHASMLRKEDRAEVERLLAPYSIEKPMQGPEPVRMRLLSETHGFSPEAGLMLLTLHYLLIYGKEKRPNPAIRTGKSLLVLHRKDISTVKQNEDTLLINTMDGISYEITLAHADTERTGKNRIMAAKWKDLLATY
ncbi:MAG: hypothetical protein HXX08_06470 [Chloroflexi bacterium]|uniref:Uncharacterized protein n=1 Tax=Candidatus Chlorohelix allophototropha TaxID=3003348 RepID=A0A8T7LU11_9CHLR|nr:hypothetical protein [Chloroflexota bacterium]WJW67377.1 hypothetical protein OZ401_000642 [Chloroflexota bacterium L227-S17]